MILFRSFALLLFALIIPLLFFEQASATAVLIGDYTILLKTKGSLPTKPPKIILKLIGDRKKPPEEIEFTFKKKLELKKFEFTGNIRKLFIKIDCTNSDSVNIESVKVILKNIKPHPCWLASPRLEVVSDTVKEGTYEMVCVTPLK